MTILHSFDYNDGGYPLAGLTRDKAGNLYGTTAGGFSCMCGSVYELAPSGALTTLKVFGGKDGAFPQSVLVLDDAGNLYGNASQGPHDAGVIFKITP